MIVNKCGGGGGPRLNNPVNSAGHVYYISMMATNASSNRRPGRPGRLCKRLQSAEDFVIHVIGFVNGEMQSFWGRELTVLPHTPPLAGRGAPSPGRRRSLLCPTYSHTSHCAPLPPPPPPPQILDPPLKRLVKGKGEEEGDGEEEGNGEVLSM